MARYHIQTAYSRFKVRYEVSCTPFVGQYGILYKVDNLILHSDQGWQYQMKPYQNLLKAKGITQSMSRKATCLDNAVAENFFALLKTELFYLEKFDSVNQLEKAIVEYIDYYNNRRIKLKLNGLSPVQYRIQTVQVA